MSSDPTPPTPTPAPDTDPYGEAAAGLATAAPDAPEQEAPGAPVEPSRWGGRKYPRASDYNDTDLAVGINGFMDAVFKVDGLAEKCQLGGAATATLDYYASMTGDVHPLIQLAVASGAFGIGVGLAKHARQEQERTQRARGDADAPPSDAALRIRERMEKARAGKVHDA